MRKQRMVAFCLAFLAIGSSPVWGQIAAPQGPSSATAESAPVILLDQPQSGSAGTLATPPSTEQKPAVDYGIRDKGSYEILRLGGEAYEADDTEKAIACYTALVERGVSNGDLFFNLANAYFRQGEFGPAVLYYEKAHRLRPRDRDILQNLAYTQTFLIDERDEKETSPLDPLLVLHTESTTNETLWLLSVLNAALVGLLILGSLRLRVSRSVYFGYIKGPVVVLFILQAASAGYRLGWESRERQGVLLADEVEAKAAPTAEEVLVELNSGTKVDLLEIRDGYAHIRLPNGIPAFIPEETLGEI